MFTPHLHLLLIIIIILGCSADPGANLPVIRLFDVPHAASKGQPVEEGLSSIEQRSSCDWTKVVSQHIDPFDQCGM